MGETTKTICAAVITIVSVLVVGEVLGNAVSRPIQTWRRRGVNVEQLAELIAVLNQRICNLEEKKEIEA